MNCGTDWALGLEVSDHLKYPCSMIFFYFLWKLSDPAWRLIIRFILICRNRSRLLNVQLAVTKLPVKYKQPT